MTTLISIYIEYFNLFETSIFHSVDKGMNSAERVLTILYFLTTNQPFRNITFCLRNCMPERKGIPSWSFVMPQLVAVQNVKNMKIAAI